MGSKYTTQTASGFNSSPPPDDGSQNASNLITWSGIKTKLADPTKNLADAINTALVTALDYSVRQISSSDTVLASDHMKTVEIAPSSTSGITVTLSDAATMTNNFRVFVKNSSAFQQTIARATSGDTIDGVAGDITIPPLSSVQLSTTTGADGYVISGEYGVAAQRINRPHNFSLALSVSSSALTIALKNAAGNDPTGGDAVIVPFRSVTAATGTTSVLRVTSANSLVVSSGSTLGTRSNVAFRVWIVAFNDAGTFRLGAINCVTTTSGAGAGSDVTGIYPLRGWGIASSTAEGGAGAADSAQTFYTGTAVSSKSYVVLGYATWESGLGTAGTWSAGPTRVQLFGPGVPLPSDVIQTQRTPFGSVATGTTVLPRDDTIPQNTEGDQYMSQAITPSSAANVLDVDILANLSVGANVGLSMAIFRDSTANALCAEATYVNTVNQQWMHPYPMRHRVLADSGSATTFKLRAGPSAAGTVTFNGEAAARLFGGVSGSYMAVAEIMG